MNLGRLFADTARVAELRGQGNPTLLLPAEAVFLGRSVPKRAQEFAAGRVCARRALAAFGIEDFPIERAADRQPIWPLGMVGSITHTLGFCAAVVAARETTAAIGLDTEVVDVKPRLWPSICVESEIRWIETLPAPQRVRAATLIFSAKEAFYKCQYPLAREHLGFHDAQVDVHEWNGQVGSFSIAATRSIAFAARTPMPLTGQYLFHDEFVSAGLSIGRLTGDA